MVFCQIRPELQTRHRVTAETLDWTQCVPHSLDGGEKDPGQKGASCNKGNVVHPIWDREWDLVIGSDLVYNSVGVEVLPRVLERLARRGSLVLYGHSLGRFELMDNAFKDNLRGLGLDVKQASGGSDTTATSAEDAAGEEFVMELFPELRPVVFIIEPAHPDAGS